MLYAAALPHMWYGNDRALLDPGNKTGITYSHTVFAEVQSEHLYA